MLVVAALLPFPARADEGALTFSASAGVAAERIAAPAGDDPVATWGAVPAAAVGARYALTDGLELQARVLADGPASYFHEGVAVTTPNGRFVGTLAHRTWRLGATVGARLSRGRRLRPFAGVGLGWARRFDSQLQLLSVGADGAAFDQGLSLQDRTVDAALGLGELGVQLLAGDHVSFELELRVGAATGSPAGLFAAASLGGGFSLYP